MLCLCILFHHKQCANPSKEGNLNACHLPEQGNRKGCPYTPVRECWTPGQKRNTSPLIHKRYVETRHALSLQRRGCGGTGSPTKKEAKRRGRCLCRVGII